MKKFEYKIEQLESYKNGQESILNTFGEEGWELIHIFHYPNMIKYTFKREKYNII